jgi:hypothetical protein
LSIVNIHTTNIPPRKNEVPLNAQRHDPNILFAKPKATINKTQVHA